MPFEPLRAEGRPPLPDADRFLERAFELAIAGRLPLLSCVTAGRPLRAPLDYLARVPSSFWMVGVHAVAGWLLVSVQIAAVS